MLLTKKSGRNKKSVRNQFLISVGAECRQVEAVFATNYLGVLSRHRF